MRYLDEYRDPVLARRLVREIRAAATRPWSIMEVCGGQTHTIVRQGIDELIPVRMVHGPGCPVCVTPLATIDRALAIAARSEVIFTSFGDMLRVPGSGADLLSAKARGADVRVVYSPLDAVKLAAANPDGRWCSSRSASRPRRRPTRWPCSARTRNTSATSASWSATSWCLQRWPRSWSPPPWTPSWRPGTCAR